MGFNFIKSTCFLSKTHQSLRCVCHLIHRFIKLYFLENESIICVENRITVQVFNLQVLKIKKGNFSNAAHV